MISPLYCRGIFDVNIDTLTEKPWKVPGVDITDYFNFGFNESSWKLYRASSVGILLCPRDLTLYLLCDACLLVSLVRCWHNLFIHSSG